MNKFKEFFRSKAFYIAFGTGILAFSGLLLMYNYSDNREGLKREQAIDLNQPVEMEEIANNTDELVSPIEETPETQPVESDGVLTGEEVAEINNENAQDISTEAGADVTAENGEETEDHIYENVVVDVVADGSIITGYSYEGEQSLAWPLAGNIVIPYSMDTTVYFSTLGSYKCNPGILISGDEGEDIVAAYDGVVESIVDDKEHGTLVNINMGNGYVASYGQLMNVTVAEGDEVTLGQNIGEIAPVTSYYTQEGNHLYFQMTKDGEPINPLDYIQ